LVLPDPFIVLVMSRRGRRGPRPCGLVAVGDAISGRKRPVAINTGATMTQDEREQMDRELDDLMEAIAKEEVEEATKEQVIAAWSAEDNC